MTHQKAPPSLHKKFLLILLVFLCLPVLLLGTLSVIRELQRFNDEAGALRQEYIESQKTILQKEVVQALNYVRYNHTLAEERLKHAIKERVYEAHHIAMHIYRTYQGTRTQSEIQTMVKEALRPIRFNHGRGYYFATSLTGIEELFVDRPDLEGKNLLELQDTHGQYVIRDMIQLVHQSGEGFYQYTWTKPGETGQDFRKIAFVKYFEPFEWFLGTGEYLDDVEADIQREALEYLRNVRFQQEGYLFGSTYEGDPLFTSGEITVGTGSVWELTDPHGVKIIQEQRRAATQPEGGFVRYVWQKLTHSGPSPKISFVKGFPEWQWIIGAGVYLDDIDAVILQKRNTLRQQILQTLLGMVSVWSVLLLGLSVIANRLAQRIQKSFCAFATFFHSAATTSTKIAENTLYFKEFRTMAASANRMLDEYHAIRHKREQAENALRASEEQFRKLFHTVQAGVIVQAADGTIVHANEMACEIFMMSTDEITSKTSTDAVWHMITEDGTAVPGEEHPSMITIRTGQPIRHAIRGIFADDRARLRWLLINTAPIVDTVSGQLQQVVITFLDITKVKLAEENVRRLNAELEQRVQLRTAELETVNRELNDFAYVVSHDLKAPLRGISRLACWLGEDYADVLDDEGKQMTRSLIGRVTRMDNFIDGLLEYSRIGRIKGQYVRVDLNYLVTEIVERLAPPAHIVVSISPDLPVFIGDRARLIQIFQHLIGNAIQFMDKPESRITVDVQETDTTWTFRIADNGPGIELKYHDKIFQIFQTLTPRDVKENTGIGLALVKKIVELSGGRIWLESVPGQGSAFFFTLPRVT